MEFKFLILVWLISWQTHKRDSAYFFDGRTVMLCLAFIFSNALIFGFFCFLAFFRVFCFFFAFFLYSTNFPDPGFKNSLEITQHNVFRQFKYTSNILVIIHVINHFCAIIKTGRSTKVWVAASKRVINIIFLHKVFDSVGSVYPTGAGWGCQAWGKCWGIAGDGVVVFGVVTDCVSGCVSERGV